MIRDIFVPLLRQASDDSALDVALAMALANDAHISALVTLEHPMPVVTELGYVPLEMGQKQLEDARAAAEFQAAHARARLASEAVSSEVRVTEVMMLWSEEAAALKARHADISVLGGPDPTPTTPRFSLTFNTLLLHSGRPVLVVPTGATLSVPPQKVVLAWTPTREATRALHDALPLLSKASEIDVLMIDPQTGLAGHGQEPGADIARHLARHGLSVRVVAMPHSGLSDGASLLRYVDEVDADLLVMGGYGHARWRQVVLGGATHAVLQGARKPVFFAH